MEDIRGYLKNGAGLVRNSLKTPYRDVAARWALGASAVALVVERSAQALPDRSLPWRMARGGLSLVAAGAFAVSMLQAKRYGELKDHPASTDHAVTEAQLLGIQSRLMAHIENSNNEQSRVTGDGGSRDIYAEDLARLKLAPALGMAQVCDIAGFPVPGGHESWGDVVRSEATTRITWVIDIGKPSTPNKPA